MRLKQLLIAACAVAALPCAALAQPPRVAAAHPHFAAGSIVHFAPRDLAAWRGGYWWHGWRGGRMGWWWFADGYWYWYAEPVYPYPAYVAGDYVAGGYPSPGGAPWWYCDNPPGYYPYVRDCRAPWRPVRPTPQR